VSKTHGLGSIFDFELYVAPNEDGGQNLVHFWSDAGSPMHPRSTGTVTDMNWHHLAVTRSGTTLTFYIDGVEAGTTEVTGSFNNNPLPLRIGTDGPEWGVGSMFEGVIDDVRLYNRGLSAVEIQALLPPPRLNITRSGPDVILSWPAAQDFMLEKTDSLAPASWTPVTNPPTTVVGDQKTVTLPISGSAGSYRLRK
jgi:hypothetical protein